MERDGFVRPHWLDFTVHGSNSIAAWGDILISQERSFSPQARLLAMGFAAAYSVWAVVVKFGYGKVCVGVRRAGVACRASPCALDGGSPALSPEEGTGEGRAATPGPPA